MDPKRYPTPGGMPSPFSCRCFLLLFSAVVFCRRWLSLSFCRCHSVAVFPSLSFRRCLAVVVLRSLFPVVFSVVVPCRCSVSLLCNRPPLQRGYKPANYFLSPFTGFYALHSRTLNDQTPYLRDDAPFGSLCSLQPTPDLSCRTSPRRNRSAMPSKAIVPSH